MLSLYNGQQMLFRLPLGSDLKGSIERAIALPGVTHVELSLFPSCPLRPTLPPPIG